MTPCTACLAAHALLPACIACALPLPAQGSCDSMHLGCAHAEAAALFALPAQGACDSMHLGCAHAEAAAFISLQAQQTLTHGPGLQAAHILVATGARAFVPPIEGAEHAIISDDILDLPELPAKIAVIGGGYIALEFAGIYNNFGTEVHVLYRQVRAPAPPTPLVVRCPGAGVGMHAGSGAPHMLCLQPSMAQASVVHACMRVCQAQEPQCTQHACRQIACLAQGYLGSLRLCHAPSLRFRPCWTCSWD